MSRYVKNALSVYIYIYINDRNFNYTVADSNGMALIGFRMGTGPGSPNPPDI